MKKALPFLFAVALALLPRALHAQAPTTLFTGLTASGNFGCGVDPSTGLFTTCDMYGASKMSIQITLTGGSTGATFDLMCRNDPSQQYKSIIHWVNPVADEEGYYWIEPVGQCYVAAVVSSGTYLGTMVRTTK